MEVPVWLTWTLACSGDDGKTDVTDTSADSDTDTDSDTDSDTDTDTDSDTDTDPHTGATGATAHTGVGAHSGLTPLGLDEAEFDGRSVLLDGDGLCYDALFWAVDAGAVAMLRANVANASYLANGAVYQATIDLAAPPTDVSVEAWTGSQLTGNLCVGAYNPYGNPVIAATWRVVAGSLDLTLDGTGAYGGTGDLVFTGLQLEDGTGRTGRIDELAIHGVGFPLFPP